MQQRWKPSLVVVGGLLVLAIVMVIVLWAAAQTQGDGGGSDTTAPPGVVTVADLALFDPQGTGIEADRNPIDFKDGRLQSPWQTVCYRTADFSEKDGIGLVLTLSGVTDGGQLEVLFGTEAWTADVYAVDGPEPSTNEGVAAWGPPIASASSADFGTKWPVTLPGKANRLLVFLREGGQDDSCSGGNTYRGRINALTFTAA